MNCINTNSALYRELARLSVLPEILLKAEISQYLEMHDGRFPNIDELPGANSKESIKQDLKIREDGTSTVLDIVNFTGTSDLNTANSIINDKYRDLDVELIPILKTVIVNIKDRPSMFKYRESPKNDFSYVDSTMFLVSSLEKMAKTMGINIKYTSTAQMKANGLLDLIPEAALADAFVFNGDVYINTDLASINAKIHELLHILLGSIRFKLPDLYFALVDSMLNISNLEDYEVLYPNRSKSDLLEEVFVELLSKHLVGIDNEISKLPDDILYLINYNINRVLDTILMGDNSVSAIDDETLYSSSLKDIAEIVNSSTMPNIRQGFLEDALMHRILSNVKQELLELGDLKEEC